MISVSHIQSKQLNIQYVYDNNRQHPLLCCTSCTMFTCVS